MSRIGINPFAPAAEIARQLRTPILNPPRLPNPKNGDSSPAATAAPARCFPQAERGSGSFEEAARVYIEARLWPNGPVCPVCGLGDRITARKGKSGFYQCVQCKEDFTVRTGTMPSNPSTGSLIAGTNTLS